jgi:hypothetical protein
MLSPSGVDNCVRNFPTRGGTARRRAKQAPDRLGDDAFFSLPINEV